MEVVQPMHDTMGKADQDNVEDNRRNGEMINNDFLRIPPNRERKLLESVLLSNGPLPSPYQPEEKRMKEKNYRKKTI